MRRYGESRQHEKAKERIGQLLRQAGFNVWVDTHPFECQTEKGPRTYWPDVYATNFCMLDSHESKDVAGQKGARRIMVEVSGFKGHKSKSAYFSDRARLQDIRSNHGPIDYYEVRLGSSRHMDVRSWSEADILEHLQIDS